MLFTVLAASAAAVVAGTMLTGGRRAETVRKMNTSVHRVKDWMMRKGLLGDRSSVNRGQIASANPPY